MKVIDTIKYLSLVVIGVLLILHVFEVISSKVNVQTLYASGLVLLIITIYFVFLNIEQKKTIMEMNRQIKELVHTNEMLEKKARTDSLTGFLQKNIFEKEVTEYLKPEHVSQDNKFLLFLDIDDFKKINDNCGHIIGDKVLRIVCDKIRNQLCGECILGRYGGEELLAFVSGKNKDEIVGNAKQIISELREVYINSDYPNINISVSIGIAKAEQGITYNELLQRADSTMYKVKKGGKDGVQVW